MLRPLRAALPFMLQSRAGFASPGITSTADRRRTPRLLADPLPAMDRDARNFPELSSFAPRKNVLSRSERRHCIFPARISRIAPRRRMIGMTGRFDLIDNGRIIAISLSAYTGVAKRWVQVPPSGGEDRLKSAVQRDADCAGWSGDFNLTEQGVHRVLEHRPPFLRNEPTASCQDSDDDELFARLAKCRAFADHDGAGSVTNSGTDGKDA